MTREERLEYCSICTNRTFDRTSGIICSLTNDQASFEGSCSDFKEDEQEVKINDAKVEETKRETHRTIDKGRYALFLISGMYIIVGFLEAYVIDGHDLLFGFIDWFVAAVFAGLAIWSYKNAFLAFIIGLGFYLAIVLLLAVIDPATIVKGIIWKALIIYALVYGIKTAKAEKEHQRSESGDLLDQI